MADTKVSADKAWYRMQDRFFARKMGTQTIAIILKGIKRPTDLGDSFNILRDKWAGAGVQAPGSTGAFADRHHEGGVPTGCPRNIQ